MALTKVQLIKAGHDTLRMAQKVGASHQTERWLHGVLLGALQARVGDMTSEYQVGGGRIDFRHGGSNPSVVELVVRYHMVEEAPSSNRTELSKLCKVRSTQARTRYLLILDVSEGQPVKKRNLQRSYGKYNAGRGRFERQPIRIVYLHPESRHDFDFVWTPYAK
jgi:hypothetical protein